MLAVAGAAFGPSACACARWVVPCGVSACTDGRAGGPGMPLSPFHAARFWCRERDSTSASGGSRHGYRNARCAPPQALRLLPAPTSAPSAP